MAAAGSGSAFALAPDFAQAVAPRGPGRLGRAGVPGVLLFDTVGLTRLDLLAQFFRDEVGTLDWRADFIRSAELDDLIDGLEDKIEIETEIEEVYAKSELTMTDLPMDDY